MASAGVTRSTDSYPAMDGNGGECCRAGPRAALRPMLINERNGVGLQHSQIPVDAAGQTSKLRTVGRTDVNTAHNRRSDVETAHNRSIGRTILSCTYYDAFTFEELIIWLVMLKMTSLDLQ